MPQLWTGSDITSGQNKNIFFHNDPGMIVWVERMDKATITNEWSLFFSSNTNFNMELCQRGKCWRDTLFCIWKVNASCGATRSRIFKIRFLRPGNCTRLPEVANCNDYTVIALCNFTIYMSWSAQIW